MQRPILTSVLFLCASAGLLAQQSQSNPYEGTSHPPADDNITASEPEQPKPPAGKPLVAHPAPSVASSAPSKAVPVAPANQFTPAADDAVNGTDDGIVQVAPDPSDPAHPAPGLRKRARVADPDGDMVHVAPLPPGVLAPGATIRVHLMTELSTARSEEGEAFRSKVASDVLQNGQVLIPTGAEIDGRVVDVSMGHAGGHGSIRLRPDTVILPDGTRYQLDAQVSGVPGTNTSVNDEGVINAGSRYKKDGIEYGGAVGAGAVAGAALGGPVGALTGSIIGAGAVTAHLLVDHPQADLEPGTVLLITLTEPLNLVASKTGANAPPAAN